MSSPDSIQSQLSFVLLGGIPTKRDIAPSAIFLAAYVVAAIAVVFRLSRRVSRSRILFRVAIFTAARLGAFITRLAIAIDINKNKNPGRGLVTAEIILFMAGFIALVEPCFSLVTSLIETEMNPLLFRLSHLVRLAVIAVIVLVIIAGINLSSPTVTDPSKYELMRHIGYGITLGITVLSVALALLLGPRAVRSRVQSSAGLALAVGANLLAVIVAVYRLVQSFSKANQTVNNIAVFYVVDCLVEVLIVACLVVPNLRRLYNMDVVDKIEHGGAVELGNRPPQVNYV